MDLILFGAGNTGKNFIESELFKTIKDKYENIYFWDNNQKLVGKNIGNITVVDKEFKKKDFEIIITSIFWNQIYEQCVEYDVSVIKIFDKEYKDVTEYKQMCQRYHVLYKNPQYIKYMNDKKQRIEYGIKEFMRTDNLFDNINEVAIMLSNLCNYALIHKKCPANCVKNKEILSSKVVYKILDELAEGGFRGTLCFHIYNEPLIDPRLFLFICYIKQNLPNAKVEVYSNAYYLNETMVEELQEIGVDILIVTAYGEAEYRRLLNLNIQMAYSVLYEKFDERLDFYTERREAISSKECKNFFTQVSIYSNGDIGTCCLDYKHAYNLGNVVQNTLKECLNSERIINFQKELLNGNRTMFPICKNCGWLR